MTTRPTYLDASAFVKLVTEETESSALERWLHERSTRMSSALLRTEAIRAGRRIGGGAVQRARTLLAEIDLIAIDDDILEIAATLEPMELRSLDAIHLATAQSLADDLEALVTYDVRMVEAADRLGLPVASPA